MNTGLVVLLLFSLLPIAGSEQTKERKQAWEWTAGERIATRFDPVSMRARLRQNQVDVEAAHPMSAEPAEDQDPTTDYVDGRRNPELLFPWEIFNNLLATAFGPDPQTRALFREEMETTAQASGLPSDIWSTLESCATPFLESRREERVLAGRLKGALSLERQAILNQVKQVQEPQCGKRAAALACARAELGPEEFNRFLYDVVAPNMFIKSVGDKERQAHLLFVEGGCR